MSMVDKPTVRVVINVTGLPNTYKETHSDNTVTYNGLFMMYIRIKQALGEKYTFVETYDEEFSVTQALNDIRDGR